MEIPKRAPDEVFTTSLDLLNDPDLQEFSLVITKVKQGEFPLNERFKQIELILDSADAQRLKLVKLLYCLGFKRELFLHLGVIIESQLNSIIRLYQSKKWKTPDKFTSSSDQAKLFDSFLHQSYLCDKAGKMVGYNLLNDREACEFISNGIQTLRILRNYGAHDKPPSLFLEGVVISDPDPEISKVLDIIQAIHEGKKLLFQNPPQSI